MERGDWVLLLRSLGAGLESIYWLGVLPSALAFDISFTVPTADSALLLLCGYTGGENVVLQFPLLAESLTLMRNVLH